MLYVQEVGDIMANYPLLKSRPDIFKSNKVMSATYYDFEGTEYEEDFDNVDAVLCFMAFEEYNNEGERS